MTGREAYEEDCRRTGGVYPFGSHAKRPSWDELPDYAQGSWNKNPTPRRWESQRAA
jgi:hypothetical protein